MSCLLHLTMACVSVKDGICIAMHCIISHAICYNNFVMIYDECIKATGRYLIQLCCNGIKCHLVQIENLNKPSICKCQYLIKVIATLIHCNMYV